MTCKHDPMFRRDNEANGGIGCPLCNQARMAQRIIDTAKRKIAAIAATQKRGGRDGWISKTARLADDLERPDSQAMTHAAIIRRANADDQFFEQLLDADDGYGMMGDAD